MDDQIDFSSIATAKFAQTMPELSNYVIAFQDVSEDLSQPGGDDIKVGVFVLRVGVEAFYVPVVSKEDNVYPIDSVFSVSNNKFFPLTKATASMMITSSKLTQGKPARIPQTVSQNPDLTPLIVPPRTGKFVYASVSRLTDFLANLPDELKTITFEKMAEEKSVYEELHNLFNVKAIYEALKPAPKGAAVQTNQIPISVVTGVGNNVLTGDELTSIVNHGYVVQGESPFKRFAVAAFNFDDGRYTQVSNLDGHCDFELIMRNGFSRESFIPKQCNVGQADRGNERTSVALFTNGDYAVAETFVAVGTKLDRVQVLETIFKQTPPVLPREIEMDEKFAIIGHEGDLVGVFRAERVVLSHLGVEIKAWCEGGLPMGQYTILAYRNYTAKPALDSHPHTHRTDRNLYIPFTSLVLMLGENITDSLEMNVNAAAKKREITEAGLLGDQLNLGFDGVEYVVNGKTVGSEADLMQLLAVQESIEPSLAASFVKQATEKGQVKVYLSKEAGESFQAQEIPKFGEPPPPVPKVGLNGSFMPNTKQSLKINDPQTTEVTIITELLQCPDMYEYIEEYMPDIEECIDKLGRTLFLTRVHIDQLAENNDADGIFAFLANLKSVYRMLGDNFLRLKEIVALKPNANKPA